MAESRKADYPIDDLFLNRRSLRAFSGESIPAETINSLFEAARWAPSCANNQTTRYIYATRESPLWETYLSILAEPNRMWCKNGALLIVVLAKTKETEPPKDYPTPAFDAGLSVENLLLQTHSKGLIGHPMIGFNKQSAREQLNIPAEYEPQAMICVGKQGPLENIPESRWDSEKKPTQRKPISELVIEGKFQ